MVEQDPAAGCLPDIHELPGVLVSRPAPTEPQVTDVTSASTAGVLVGDHQRILTRMLGEPLPGLVVKRHEEFTGHIAEYALRRPRGFDRQLDEAAPAKTSFNDLPYGQNLPLSPACHSRRRSGSLKSQSGRIFLVTSRRSW